jgi:hypothetical protein
LQRRPGGDFVDEGTLEEYYVHVPVPFKRGDLITNNKEILVFNFARDDEYPEWTEKHLQFGDTSDMNIEAYCGDNGSLDCDVYFPLTNYEYFRGKLPKGKRALGIISDYLKGKEPNLAFVIENLFILRAVSGYPDGLYPNDDVVVAAEEFAAYGKEYRKIEMGSD